jgi:hypothetical protein
VNGTLVSMTERTVTRLKLYLLLDPLPDYVIGGMVRIHPKELSGLACGKEHWTPSRLSKLCSYFHCEPEDLMGYGTCNVRDPESIRQALGILSDSHTV